MTPSLTHEGEGGGGGGGGGNLTSLIILFSSFHNMNSKSTGIYLVTMWSMVIFATLFTDKIKIQQYFIVVKFLKLNVFRNCKCSTV